ncbi:MAG TPA: MgtC/SapB family protein [Candidatus Kapabacteria bacterium]|nr:MgtC/SapB family protein [Candidatus Kapabacteria bacterium]
MGPLETFGLSSLLHAEFGVKLIVAVLCGGAIGMERETTGKSAGLRTCILVCLGSMLYTEVGAIMGKTSGGDMTRVAAQIVTGIGFLGAGVILHSKRGEVRGVTTAAMIWLMAALGMMIGAGYVLSAMAVTATSVALILGLRHLENVLRRRHARNYCFVFKDDAESRDQVSSLVNMYGEWVRHYRVNRPNPGEVQLTFQFNGSTHDRRELLRTLCMVPGLRSCVPSGPQAEPPAGE